MLCGLFRNLSRIIPSSLSVAKISSCAGSQDPSHMGISGNEKADTAAKAALSLSITPMKLPASEFFSTCQQVNLRRLTTNLGME